MNTIRMAMDSNREAFKALRRITELLNGPLMLVLTKFGGTTPEAVREFNLIREANGYRGEPAHGEGWKKLLSSFKGELDSLNAKYDEALFVIPAEFDEAYKAKPRLDPELNDADLKALREFRAAYRAKKQRNQQHGKSKPTIELKPFAGFRD